MAQFLQYIDDIVDRYDGWIVDIWGVIHNGVTIFPGIPELFSHLKQKGKKIILLSNAPRRVSIAKGRLQEMGFGPDVYDTIYTSGEACHGHLRDKVDPFYSALGQNFYHIGPVRDHTIFQGLAHLTKVGDMNEAAFLLITGTYEADDTLDNYESLLQEALSKKLPCVCANADRQVVFGDREILAGGAIAERYESLGGAVRYHGKPYPEIYTPVMDIMGLPKDRLIAVGDSLATDIRGANGVGLDSLMIMDGVHRSAFFTESGQLKQDAEQALEALRTSYAHASPTFVIPRLASLIPKAQANA